MDDADFRFLLRTAYTAWRTCLDAHAEVAIRLAGGASIPKSHLVRVRADLDRALADLMSLRPHSDVHACASESDSAGAASLGLLGKRSAALPAACAVRPLSAR